MRYYKIQQNYQNIFLLLWIGSWVRCVFLATRKRRTALCKNNVRARVQVAGAIIWKNIKKSNYGFEKRHFVIHITTRNYDFVVVGTGSDPGEMMGTAACCELTLHHGLLIWVTFLTESCDNILLSFFLSTNNISTQYVMFFK